MAVWPKFFKQHNEHVLTGYETAVKAGYKGTYEEWLGLKMDSAPTEGSSRPITSGAVYSALAEAALAEAALQEDESGGGSGGGVLVINFFWDDDQYVCSKTMSEISEALLAGRAVIATQDNSSHAINIVYATDESNNVTRVDFDFWYPHWEIENAFFYIRLSLTAEGITDTYATYQLTPYTE